LRGAPLAFAFPETVHQNIGERVVALEEGLPVALIAACGRGRIGLACGAMRGVRLVGVRAEMLGSGRLVQALATAAEEIVHGLGGLVEEGNGASEAHTFRAKAAPCEAGGIRL